MEDLLGLPILVFAVAAYCLPAMIADANDHPATPAIVMLNVLLGWTGVGWVLAFVWAMSEMTSGRSPSPAAPPRAAAATEEPGRGEATRA
jgi:hypothetical protein